MHPLSDRVYVFSRSEGRRAFSSMVDIFVEERGGERLNGKLAVVGCFGFRCGRLVMMGGGRDLL